MSKFLRYAAVGAALASLGIASGAQAATSDSANVSATILTALSVAVDPTDNTLDFASIAPGATAATVVVAPSGALTCAASVICSGTANAPTFNITGAANTAVYVRFTNPTETLSSGANSMTVDTFTTNLPTAATVGTATTDGLGAASFTVGGSLHVGASQAAGTYTGTLTVNVAYN
jgi:hypothetical protein